MHIQSVSTTLPRPAFITPERLMSDEFNKAPERRLWVAVLHAQIEDALAPAPEKPFDVTSDPTGNVRRWQGWRNRVKTHVRLREQARTWLSKTDSSDFHLTCVFAGMEPQVVADWVRKAEAAGWDIEPPPRRWSLEANVEEDQ
jgi:hypothetical protein